MKSKGLSIFQQFVLANLGLLLLPLLFCVGYGVYLNHIAKEQKIQEIQINIERTKDSFELKQQQIEINCISRILLDDSIRNVINTSSSSLDLIRASTTLRQMVAPEQDILDIAVVSLENDIIVSNTLALKEMSLFYRANYRNCGSESDWKMQYFRKDPNGYFVSDMTNNYNYPSEQIISYLQYVPSHQNTGYWIWVRWRENKFLQYITYKLGRHDSFYIYNNYGEVLATRAGKDADITYSNDCLREGVWSEEIHGNTYLFMQFYSQDTGLLYGASIDYQDAISETLYMRNIFLLCSFLVVCISLFFCIWMAKRNSDPIQSILSILKENQVGKSTYRSTMNSIEDALRIGNKSLKELKEQKERLKGMLIEKFLNNGLLEEDISSEEILKQIVDENMACSILLIRFNFPFSENMDANPDNMFTYFGKFLEEQLLDRAYVHFSDHNTLVLIMKLPVQSSDEYLKQQIVKIQNALKNTQEISYQIVSSEIGNSIQDIPKLYDQAVQTLQYAIYQELNVCSYSELPNLKNTNFISSADEIKLVYSVRSGNIEEVSKMIEDYITNISQVEFIRQLQLNVLIVMLYRVLDGLSPEILDESIQKKIETVYKQSNKHNLSTQEQIKSLYREITLNIAKHQTERGQLLWQKILNLIDERFSDPQFCMQEILSQFNISATTLQTIFKKQAGSSFYKYLEDLRLRKACAILTQTSLSINEISEQVGYTSPASFRRAFKKLYNISPADYREASNYH
jgi:two-component system response regulator YesN